MSVFQVMKRIVLIAKLMNFIEPVLHAVLPTKTVLRLQSFFIEDGATGR
jgi:hypothetical protein